VRLAEGSAYDSNLFSREFERQSKAPIA